MKDKYNELFNGELEVKKDGKDIAVIGDKKYWLFEIDDNFTCEDGKHLQRANYIANAVNNFADMYEVLEALKEDYPLSHPVSMEIEQLLKRARG